MSEQSNDKVETKAGEPHPIIWQNLGSNPNATPVTPAEFRKIMASRKENPAVYRPVATALSVQPGQAATVQSPASVSELARALKNDVDLIFYHVYNQIEFFPSYGLQKSSEATLLDGIGNAWDQASLLVGLLRAAGHTANFVFGDVEMTTAEISAWLGTDDSDPAYASNILYWGGIPYSSGSGTVTFSHIWVKVEMGGVDYILDPSIKTYTSSSGIDLEAAMDYDRDVLLDAARDGSTRGTDDLWIEDVNVAGFNAELASCATNLIDWIKANQPAATVDDIIGGKRIVEIMSPVRQTSHPYETGTPADWTSIPNTYRTTFRFQYAAAGIDVTFYADDLYGHRTTIFFNSSRQPVLRLDGTVVATGSAQSLGSGSFAYGTITHPHAPPGVNHTIELGIYAPTSTGANYYLLGAKQGATRKGMVDYHRDLVNKAMASGSTELAEELLGEQLSVGWHTLNAELTAISDMASRLSDCAATHWHSFGFHWRNTAYDTVNFDVPGGPVAVVSKVPDNEDRRKSAGYAISMSSNTLEELTINQVYNTEIGTSAARLLKIANADSSNRIYLATQSNWSTVAADLSGYTQFSPSIIYTNHLQNGGVALVPKIGGQDIGNSLHADGYRAFMPGGTVYGRLSAYKGGCGPWGWGGTCKCKHCEEEASDPVGLLTGAFKYRQTDMTVGSSSYPYQLSFETEYTSGDRYKNGSLGLGWSHNWELGAVKISEAFRGVGSSPIEAVASLVSVFVAMDLITEDLIITEDPEDLDILRLTAGSLTSSWWSEQLTFNVVSVLTDSGSVEFVKLPDGSFQSTEGDGWSVAEDAGEYTVTSPQKVDYVYNTDGDLETISFPYGVTISLTYSSGKLTAVENGMGRAFSLSYTGDRLTNVADGNGRSVGYSYDLNGRLEAITDPLENDTTFSYDAAGLMKSYFMPENPTVPMVVNTYDTLGRVASQLDMYGRVIVRVESSEVTVSGTVTADDVATITARVAGLVNGQKSVSYTVQAGDTLADVATGLKNVINADAALSGIGVSASSTGAVISFESLTSATYGLSTSLNATVVLEATATAGDVITVTVHDSGLSGGQKSVSYTVVAGDTTDTIAQALKTAINADSDITTIGVTASNISGPEHSRFALSSNSVNPTTYTTSMSANSSEKLLLDMHSMFYFAGWRTEFNNALGYSKVHQYDSNGKLVRAVDELGKAIILLYDGLSRLVEKIMPEGNRTQWIYDSNGNVVTRLEKPKLGSIMSDIVHSFTWDPTFNTVTTETDGNGNVTTFSFDSTTGQLVNVQRPSVASEIPTVSFQYNGYGQILSKVDETGMQTQFTYDTSSEVMLSTVKNTNWQAALSGTTSPADQITLTAYDSGLAGGQKSKMCTVSAGATLPDVAGELAAAINTDSEFTTLGITAKAIGATIFLSTSPGNLTTFSQAISEGATEVITLSQGLGLKTEFSYNSWGDRAWIEDPKGHRTLFVSDDKRRVIQIEPPAPFNFLTNISYDKNDNRRSIERQTGNEIHPWQIYTYSYNLANQQETATDPAGHETTKVYNLLSDIWTITDGENRTTEFIYNERGERSERKNPAQLVVESLQYTDNGKIADVKDARGNVTTYIYDDFDRLEKTVYPDETFEQNSFDANGNIVDKLTRGGQHIGFEFDNLNRVIEKSPDGMMEVSYEFDLSGRVRRVQFSASEYWEFQYDSLGRLVEEKAADGKTVTYQLDENNNIIRITHPDSWYVERTYDKLNRLTDVKLNGDTVSVAHFNYDALSRRTQVIFGNETQINYDFELNDNVSAIEMSFSNSSRNFAYDYDYDSSRKLISQSVSDARNMWVPTEAGEIFYDPANELNQYPQINENTLTYNGSGCLTNDGFWNFSYDAENHLVSAYNGSIAATYSYDPMHRRVQKNVDGFTTKFLYSGWQLIEEYQEDSSAPTRRYVYGDKLDEPLIMVDESDNLMYMYADRLGSIVATANDSGQLLSRVAYTPFGESESLQNTFGFTGQRFDVETGLYYYKNRYYSPKYGRFLQPDPLGYGIKPGSDCGCDGCGSPGAQLNLYDYVSNDPLNSVDPFGTVAIAAAVPVAIIVLLSALAALSLLVILNALTSLLMEGLKGKGHEGPITLDGIELEVLQGVSKEQCVAHCTNQATFLKKRIDKDILTCKDKKKLEELLKLLSELLFNCIEGCAGGGGGGGGGNPLPFPDPLTDSNAA